MAKTTPEKLLIKPHTTLWTSDRQRLPLLGALPEDVALVEGPGDAAIVVLFVDTAAAVRRDLDRDRDALAGARALWIAYPKGGRAEINRDSLWPVVAEYGLRPITQVAIDEVWSALRFRPLREDEVPLLGAG